MTPKITNRPIIDGINIFQGLKPAFAAGGGSVKGTTIDGAGGGTGAAIGRVALRRTNVSSSTSSVDWAAVVAGSSRG